MNNHNSSVWVLNWKFMSFYMNILLSWYHSLITSTCNYSNDRIREKIFDGHIRWTHLKYLKVFINLFHQGWSKMLKIKMNEYWSLLQLSRSSWMICEFHFNPPLTNPAYVSHLICNNISSLNLSKALSSNRRFLF